jgi:hypothetical protein
MISPWKTRSNYLSRVGRVRYTLHRIRHMLHWQKGVVVAERCNGEVWIGFMCGECEETTGWAPVKRNTARMKRGD